MIKEADQTTPTKPTTTSGNPDQSEIFKCDFDSDDCGIKYGNADDKHFLSITNKYVSPSYFISDFSSISK